MTNPFDSHSAQQHRQEAPQNVRCAVVTVSDTRTPQDDRSGQAIFKGLEEAGLAVAKRTIVPDEPAELRKIVLELAADEQFDAILITGGTGIASRDQTPETLSGLFTKELPGYGELLRMLSYQQIGPAAILSRAVGGLIDTTVVLSMPGSTAAVRLAMDKLILPEIAHLVSQARS